MNERWYVLVVKITSQDTEDRSFTPYTNKETAYRKYFEAMTGIGAGSKKITACLMDNDLNTIKREMWIQAKEPAPEDESSEE